MAPGATVAGVVRLSWRSELTDEESAQVRALLAAATDADGVAPVSEAALLRLRGAGAAHLLATAAPVDSAADPADSTAALADPAPGTDAPADPIAASANPVAAPVDPAAGTAAPAAGTEDPVAGTDGPADRTKRRTRSHETPDTPLPSDGHAGEVVGYAQLGVGQGGATGELAVHPECRRRGIGAAMVRALLAHPAATGSVLRLWAHGEHPGAVALAERLGFTRLRTLLRLRRPLDDLPPEPRLPTGVRLRPFVVGQDEAAFVEVNNSAFAWHSEQGGWTVEHVLAREAEPWFDPAGFLLAVDEEDRILGFHWTKIHEVKIHGPGAHGPGTDGPGTDGPGTHGLSLGEVYVLGVDPEEHGRGLGGALTLAGLHHLQNRGLTEVMLYVEADNEPAVRTYRRLGFTPWDADVMFSSR